MNRNRNGSRIRSRLLAAILSGLLFMTALPVVCAAEELPHAIWALLDAYSAADTDQEIIQVGTQIIDLLNSVPETDQIKEILASKYYDVADAYDRQGSFAVAADYYRRYLPYGSFMGWSDGVKIAEAKILHYTPTAELYTETTVPQVYFGAKNEPEMGVLYGQVSEAMFYGEEDHESMTLLYIDYGNPISDWDRSVLDKARQQGAAVEIAWNIQGQGAALADILNQEAYVRSFLTELNAYQDVPIYLRIGAEMNTWEITPDAASYIAAYRFIANLVHEVSPQIATVWSVSHASRWDLNMEDFYPGDEYVDWVGISAYMMRYYQGREWPVEERFNEVSFAAGDAADPVLLVSEVLQKFGDRKPIMLAECGSAHYTKPLGIDSTDWAVTNLKRMYAYVPMVYPQVKLIAYFNAATPGEMHDYALADSAPLQAAFDQAVQAPHFIQDGYAQRAALTYQKLTDGMQVGSSLPIYTYPHVYGDAEPQVTYYIDGNFAGSSAALPYRQELDFSPYADGAHTLTVSVISNGVEAVSKSYTVQKTREIQIFINDVKLETEAMPVLENGRTLVPMRAIFEALGAVVSWDEATNTATGVKDGVTVSVQIDNQQMYKNGVAIPLDVPARLIADRTMVPARAVSEAFGADVAWDDAASTVRITL